MSHDAAATLNQVGILLGFISFWLVTPEFIGEDRLNVYAGQLSKIAGTMPKIFTITSVLFLVAITSVVVVLIWHIKPHLKDDVDFGTAETQLLLFHERVSAIVAFCLISLWVSCYKKINPLVQQLTLRFVSKLASDHKRRRKALVVGGFLFFIATILQLLATLETLIR